MIEVIPQEGKTQTGAEWLKAERAVTLTNRTRKPRHRYRRRRK